MRRPPVLFFLWLAMVGCQAQETPLAQEITSEEATAQVRQLFSRYQADWNAKNLEGVFEVLADDVVQMGPNGALDGKEALTTDWQAYLTENEDLWDPTIDDIRAATDLVFIVGHFTETRTPLAGGDTETVGGEGVWVFRRESVGAWKLVLEQWFSRDPGSLTTAGGS
jgi:ketosteroid isomerase-like protein